MNDFDPEFGGEEEMRQVLTEFHRADRGVTATGIPPPADVSSNVATLHGSQFPTRAIETPQQPSKRSAKVRPETEFDFGQYHYVTTSGHDFILQMQLSCHNQGAVPIDPVGIDVLLASWEQHPPGSPSAVGPITLTWDRGSWMPAKYGEQPTIATAAGYFLIYNPNVPPILHIAFALRFAAPPYAYADDIFLAGERQEIWTVHHETSPKYIVGNWGFTQ